MYRRLSAPQALGGLLRVRTSSDFCTARAFGHLYPDDQYDNLFHIISCDPQDTFAFDFEFAKCGQGFPHDPPRCYHPCFLMPRCRHDKSKAIVLHNQPLRSGGVFRPLCVRHVLLRSRCGCMPVLQVLCAVHSSRGFEVIAGATPVLQVIFQYSVLLPIFRSWGPEGDALLDDSQPR